MRLNYLTGNRIWSLKCLRRRLLSCAHVKIADFCEKFKFRQRLKSCISGTVKLIFLALRIHIIDIKHINIFLIFFRYSGSKNGYNGKWQIFPSFHMSGEKLRICIKISKYNFFSVAFYKNYEDSSKGFFLIE